MKLSNDFKYRLTPFNERFILDMYTMRVHHCTNILTMVRCPVTLR